MPGCYPPSEECKYTGKNCEHSILNFDSAKELGLVTSLVAEYAESRAYSLARSEYCYPKNKEEKLPLPLLFDTVAGSETGALIGANLLLVDSNLANQEAHRTTWKSTPVRYASTTSAWFRDVADTLYRHDERPVAVTFGCCLLLGAAVAWIAYRCTASRTAAPGAEDAPLHVREIARYRKKTIKDPGSYDTDALEAKVATIRAGIEETQGAAGADFSSHLTEVLNATSVQELQEADARLGKTEAALARRAAAKWYVALYSGLLTFFLFFLVLFPLFYNGVTQTPGNEVLRAAVIGPAMIPAGLAASATLEGKDYFLTAWDLDNRTPRFFTKASAKDWTNQTFSNDLDLGDMVLASMSSIEYFQPASIAAQSVGASNNTYISGDNVAKSPALFSYLTHKKQLDTDRLMDANTDYTVVSIGSIRNHARLGLLS